MPSIPFADPNATRPVTAVGGHPGGDGQGGSGSSPDGAGGRHAAAGYRTDEGAGPPNPQRVRPYAPGARPGPAAPPATVQVPRQRQAPQVAPRQRSVDIPPATPGPRPPAGGPRPATVERRPATVGARPAVVGPRPAPVRRESHRAVQAGPTRAQRMVAAGVALSWYLTRMVSMLGLLAVVGIVSGTAPDDGAAPAAPDSSVSSSPTPRR